MSNLRVRIKLGSNLSHFMSSILLVKISHIGAFIGRDRVNIAQRILNNLKIIHIIFLLCTDPDLILFIQLQLIITLFLLFLRHTLKSAGRHDHHLSVHLHLQHGPARLDELDNRFAGGARHIHAINP
ncbi:hypothetical protein BpHYR1_002021 [Brachionus plicatilis]|uniref:Uncharacterized protein n=1 Tax=Brachionus plicatilis TaxID=10195 RepID=A0A3M7QBA0_BRAPC|nr:hypothetical protein BpHYR1_002021 [Brachionus plicatilis]